MILTIELGAPLDVGFRLGWDEGIPDAEGITDGWDEGCVGGCVVGLKVKPISSVGWGVGLDGKLEGWLDGCDDGTEDVDGAWDGYEWIVHITFTLDTWRHDMQIINIRNKKIRILPSN